jgi:hypothetical protein
VCLCHRSSVASCRRANSHTCAPRSASSHPGPAGFPASRSQNQRIGGNDAGDWLPASRSRTSDSACLHISWPNGLGIRPGHVPGDLRVRGGRMYREGGKMAADGRSDRPPLDSLHVAPERAKYILDGDRWGGGYRHGTGWPGKTEFPSGWDDELFADRSVLLISHRFSTVRSADRIYVLNDGYVVESGGRMRSCWPPGDLRRAFHPASIPYQQRFPGTCAPRARQPLCVHERQAGSVQRHSLRPVARPETVRCAVSSPVQWSPPS